MVPDDLFDDGAEPQRDESRAAEPKPVEPEQAAIAEDLDHDLFDFPDIDELDAVVAEAAEVTDEVHAALGAESEPTNPTSTPSAPPGDFDLDEDLFNFDELFTDAESAAGDDAISQADFLGTTEGGALEGRAKHELDALADQSDQLVHPAATTSGSIDFVVPPRIDEITTKEAIDTIRPAVDNALGRDKIVNVLTVGVVVVNALLIFFAWRASSAFETTITGLRDDLMSSLQNIQLPEGILERYSAQPVEASPKAETPENEAVTTDPRQYPSPFADYEDLEIELAQEALARGAYRDARARLYRLLANADRAPMPEATLARAEFLIAQSYFNEGESLEE